MGNISPLGFYSYSPEDLPKPMDLAGMYGQYMQLKQAREDRAIKLADEQRQAEMDTMKLQNMREEEKTRGAATKNIAKLIDAYKASQTAPMDVSKGTQTSLAAMQAAGFPGTPGFSVPQFGGGQGGVGQFAGPLGGVLSKPGIIPTTVQAPAQGGMTDEDFRNQVGMEVLKSGDIYKAAPLLKALQGPAGRSTEDQLLLDNNRAAQNKENIRFKVQAMLDEHEADRKAVADGRMSQQQFQQNQQTRAQNFQAWIQQNQQNFTTQNAAPIFQKDAQGKVYQMSRGANSAPTPVPAPRAANTPTPTLQVGAPQQTFVAGTDAPQPDEATLNRDSVTIGSDGRPMPTVSFTPPVLGASQTSTNVPGKEGGVGTVTEPTATGTPPLGAPPAAPVNAPGSQFTVSPGGTGNSMRWQLNPRSLSQDRNMFYQSKANQALQEAQRARSKVIEHIAGYKAARAAGDPAAISELGVLMDTIQGLNKGKISDSEMAEFMGLQTKWQQLQNWRSSYASQDDALMKLAPGIVKALDKFSQDTYRADTRSWKSAREQYNALKTPGYHAANLLPATEGVIPDLPESYNMDSPATSAAPVSAPPAGVPPTAVSGFSKALNMKVWYDKASNAFYDASGKVVKSGQ